MPQLKRSLSSTRLIRSFNAVSVLQTLYREGPSSKAGIARATTMSPATVTRIIAELTAQGLVSEDRIAESTGGRKPVVFRLNHDKLYVVGIQLVRDRFVVGLCDVRGKIRARRLLRPYSLNPADLVAELAAEFELLLGANGINRGHILGCGLAVSGIVEAEHGLVLRSVNLGWRDVRIAEALEEALGFPVVVENDANAAALAELWFGSGKEVPDFVYLKTDTGVGAGIVCNGRLVTGRRGMAGEIGHVPMVKDGRPCVCGQRGCLETYLYAQGLLRGYEAETGIRLEDIQVFLARLAAGEPAARAMLREAVEALALAAANAVMLLDLDLLVIGGLWGALGDRFCGEVEERCNRVIERSGLAKTVRVRGSALGDDSDLLGAVGIVIHKWFTPTI